MNEKQANVMVGQNVIAHVKTIKRKVLNTEEFKDELEKYYKEIEYKQLNFKAKKVGKKMVIPLKVKKGGALTRFNIR